MPLRNGEESSVINVEKRGIEPSSMTATGSICRPSNSSSVCAFWETRFSGTRRSTSQARPITNRKDLLHTYGDITGEEGQATPLNTRDRPYEEHAFSKWKPKNDRGLRLQRSSRSPTITRDSELVEFERDNQS